MAIAASAANSTADLDFQLVSTLREIDPHNYSYLFQLCKNCNVNARQLRFLKKDHIRKLIPKNELGILAEFEYLLNKWQISKGFASFDTKLQLNRANESKNLIIAQGKCQILSNNQTTKTEDSLTILGSDNDANSKQVKEGKLTLENTIPVVLNKCNEIYKKNKILSARDRRLLTNSIVDYFESRKLKFTMNAMDTLAKQIVEHFPTEDKKSWFNRGGNGGRGRLYLRHRSTRSNKVQQLNRNISLMAKQVNSSTSTTNSTLNEPESCEGVYDESKSIQAWLKANNCEKFSEIIDLWGDTMKYRCWQTQNLKDLKNILEFLNNWPSYKLETGHMLLTMDFEYLYPKAMESFRTRWLVYKQNIEAFLEAELKDVNCIKLLEKYQLQKATTNEDSCSCILIYLVHAITKPLRHYKTDKTVCTVRYAITDSQHSMTRLIDDYRDVDLYMNTEPCIYAVGNSLLELKECFVVFADLRYKLSYENCLAVCVQLFTLLQVKDPQASECFWEFIRGYMFNIAKDKEKSNAITKNMINYLETAASSI